MTAVRYESPGRAVPPTPVHTGWSWGPAWRLHAHVLPRPGPVWGDYPVRAAGDRWPPWHGWRGLLPASVRARRLAQDARDALPRWRDVFTEPGDGAQRDAALLGLRRRLRRDGLDPATAADALAAAGAAAARVIGLAPRPGQWLAAAALLDGHWVEMATGEGKTLALALAACAGALAGVPVHAITANDYLAERDARRLAPLYHALGLSVAWVVSPDEAVRREAYRADVVYATAKTLAFDHLRDDQGLQTGAPPRLRGLCMALLDELDSILLDEAQVPLVLSRTVPQPAWRVALWQALAVARQLQPSTHVDVDLAAGRARLSAAGEAEAERRVAMLGGSWQRPRFRRELLGAALTALHALRRDEHYLVRDGKIELLDAITGRAAPGRQWSRGLQTLVALKEGLAPTPETETLARLSFQRFFLRYWRLAGLSGTVREARRELRRTYGLSMVQVPLHQPSRRVDGACRVFASDEERWDAVAARVAALQAQGRPVLVGTDTLPCAQALSDRLSKAGVDHQVLHAMHEAREADIVAQAGQAGRVTVATRMAGRGTDIAIDDRARGAGGLHVINCQCNASARADRQLLGRAARHGDPGSTETWLSTCKSGDRPQRGQPTLPAWITFSAWLPPWPGGMRLMHRLQQVFEDRRAAALRAELLRQDREWQRRLPEPSPWA